MAVVWEVEKPLSNRATLFESLRDLYERYPGLAEDPYLQDHATAKFIDHQVRVFSWYARHLANAETMLDWGCRHAPDSCLARALFGDAIELQGCDFFDDTRYQTFHEAAALNYQQLDHLIDLPYADQTFDAVISSGVLEHVAQDYESLKEVHRILRPGGKLIITYIPNRLSCDEWYLRRAKKPHHRRLYGRMELSQLLKRSGFYPFVAVQYQSFLWEKRLEGIMPAPGARGVGAVLKKIFPLHVFSSTLCCVAEKMTSF